MVILQQTNAEDANTDADPEKADLPSSNLDDRTVLEEVIERATARHEAQREIEGRAQDFHYSSL